MLCKVLGKTCMERMWMPLETDSWEMKLNPAKLASKTNAPFRSLLKPLFIWFTWLHKNFVESSIKAKKTVQNNVKNWKVIPGTLFYRTSFQTNALCFPCPSHPSRVLWFITQSIFVYNPFATPCCWRRWKELH